MYNSTNSSIIEYKMSNLINIDGINIIYDYIYKVSLSFKRQIYF